MKTGILGTSLAMLLFAACNSGIKDSGDTSTATDTGQTGFTTKTIKAVSPIEGTVSEYINLKYGLTGDDNKNAVLAGNSLVKALVSIDKSTIPTEQAKVFADVFDDAKEHAEHIGSNAGKIKHQREHFETLRGGIYDLVKAGNNTA